MKGHTPSFFKPKPRQTRKSVRQHKKDERDKVIKEIIGALIENKRSIPKEWHRAYMNAVTVVETYD